MNNLQSYQLFETTSADEAIGMFNAVGPMKIIKRWELYFGDENVGKTLIFINGDKLKIDEIDIYKSVQGKGYATMYMDQIAKAADKNNVTLVLTPSNYKGSSKKRLEEFYKRFGFVMNKGRAKDYSISELMYRKP